MAKMRVYENGAYREMTTEEIDALQNAYTVEMQIEDLKKNLSDTDYKAIKFAEGLIISEEYETVKRQRQEWRNKINLLEAEL